MRNLYKSPEADILEIKLVSDICGPSQGDITDVPGDYEDPDGDEI